MANAARSNAYDVDSGNSGAEDGNGGADGGHDGDGGEARANGANGFRVVEPGRVGRPDGDDGGTGGSGRKPRSDRGQRRGPRGKKENALDLGGLAEIISECHSMLAFATGIGEFALDESKGEHEKLARAVERVASHYNIPMLDPVTRDWLMLAKTAGIIYGSRAMAYYLRTQADKATAQRPAPAPAPATAAPPRNPVNQAATPTPVNPPRAAPRYVEVLVPGQEHAGPVRVQVN